MSITESKKTTLERFLYSLSIPLLGKSASKMISEATDHDFNSFMNVMSMYGASYFKYIPGIGDVLINNLDEYFKNSCHLILELSKEFTFEKPKSILHTSNSSLDGKTFVVTGSVNHYKNRDELKADIVAHGGKVSGSVSSKTDYLINNDLESNSSKNKKAKELFIKIISEDQFLEMIK